MKETIRRFLPFFVVVVSTVTVAIYAYLSGVMAVALGMLIVSGGAISGLVRRDRARRQASV